MYVFLNTYEGRSGSSNMIFLPFLGGTILACLDPDSQTGPGSDGPTESRCHSGPDPKHWFKQSPPEFLLGFYLCKLQHARVPHYTCVVQ
jgi:hypothetical protein